MNSLLDDKLIHMHIYVFLVNQKPYNMKVIIAVSWIKLTTIVNRVHNMPYSSNTC